MDLTHASTLLWVLITVLTRVGTYIYMKVPGNTCKYTEWGKNASVLLHIYKMMVERNTNGNEDNDVTEENMQKKRCYIESMH